MKGRGVVYRINIGLLLALIVGSGIVWPALPERIPIHFGFDGKADGWTDRSLLVWFLLPMLAVLVTVVIDWAGRLIQRRPDLINIPSKEAFLALTPAQRQPVIDTLRRSMCWLAMIITSMFGVIQIGSYRTALGDDGEVFIMVALGIGIVVMSLMSAIMLASVQSRLDAQIRAARANRENPGR